jgi:hypothetical protein
MKKKIELGEVILYKTGNTYTARLEPSFYIAKSTFDKIQGDCNHVHSYFKGPYDEYYYEDCKVTGYSCHVGSCVNVEEKHRMPEHGLRKNLAELLTREIKDEKREKITIKNSIRLAKFDKESTKKLEKKLSDLEEEIGLLEEIDAETVKLTYKPTPRIVYGQNSR